MILARRERHALCDLAVSLGPDVPTLCGDWTARDLVAHLLVRESSLLGSAGIPFAPLSGFTERAMARASRRPFPEMVTRLRDPGLTPYRLPLVERLANTLEYLVHHEDLRRAQPDWTPRSLPAADEDEVWSQLRIAGRMASRKVPVPLVLARPSGAVLTLRKGPTPVTVTGAPSELVLMMFGRKQLSGLSYDGPSAAVELVKGADLSF